MHRDLSSSSHGPHPRASVQWCGQDPQQSLARLLRVSCFCLLNNNFFDIFMALLQLEQQGHINQSQLNAPPV
jgi:hypothetical protein